MSLLGNQLYLTGRTAFAEGSINWLSGSIFACLVHNSSGGTSYTPNFTTDQFLSIIPSAAIIAAGQQIPSTTVTNGVCNGGSVLFSSVATAPQIDAIVIYNSTGTAGTSQLIAWIDTGANLPIVPNGGSITITWDTGVNKIFTL